MPVGLAYVMFIIIICKADTRGNGKAESETHIKWLSRCCPGHVLLPGTGKHFSKWTAKRPQQDRF